MSVTFLAAMAAMAGGVEPPLAQLHVQVAHLRNAKGFIHACLTRDPKHFPDCRGDPDAITATVPASAGAFRFSALAPGAYALTVFHDENRNHRLDTAMGIPREGFAFSNDPRVRFGAPKFRQVVTSIPSGQTALTVRMQYLL